MNRILLAAFLAAGIAGAANAQNTAAPAPPLEIKRNRTLEDATGRSIGKVFEVDQADGYVVIVDQMKLYHIPISSLTADGAKLKTSLTRAQIGL